MVARWAAAEKTPRNSPVQRQPAGKRSPARLPPDCQDRQRACQETGWSRASPGHWREAAAQTAGLALQTAERESQVGRTAFPEPGRASRLDSPRGPMRTKEIPRRPEPRSRSRAQAEWRSKRRVWQALEPQRLE